MHFLKTLLLYRPCSIMNSTAKTFKGFLFTGREEQCFLRDSTQVFSENEVSEYFIWRGVDRHRIDSQACRNE